MTIQTIDQIARPRTRGRDSQLVRMRNIGIIKRYYYWSEIKRRRTDDVLDILSKQEFFLSTQTIWKIIKKNYDLIATLRSGKDIDCGKLEDENQLKLFK